MFKPEIIKQAIIRYQQRFHSSPVGKRLMKGFIWALMGTVISRGLIFLSSVAAARFLGITQYGQLGIVMSTVTMLSTIAGFSIGLMSTKYVAEFYRTDPVRAGKIISISSAFSWITGGVMAISLALFSRVIATHTLAAPYLTFQLQMASILLLLGSINGAQIGSLYGFEAFKITAQVGFIRGITAFATIILGAWVFGLNGAILGNIMSQAIGCIVGRLALNRMISRHGIPRNPSNRFSEIKLFWKFGMPATLAGVMVGPVLWVSNAFIVNQPNGYSEMGLFSAASQIRQFIGFLPSTLASVALPMLSNFKGLNVLKSYKKLFWVNLLMSLTSALFIAVPVIIFAPWIMSRFGDSFNEGSGTLIILCVVAVISSTLSTIGDSIASEDRMWAGFMLNLIWASIMLLMSYIMRRHGAVGLAIANLIAYLMHLITSSIYIRRRFGKWESPA